MVGRFPEQALARIIELRVSEGLRLDEICHVLEAERVPTRNGGRWWPGSVRWLLQRGAAWGDAGAKEALAVRVERRSRSYKGGWSTPADVVERIVGLRSLGISLQEIGEMLEADGVPTTRGGLHWGPSTVRNVLMSAGGYEPLHARKAVGSG